MTLGELHTQLGKLDQALVELNRALARDPGSGPIHTRIAVRCTQRQRRDAEAEATYRKADLARTRISWSNLAYYGCVPDDARPLGRTPRRPSACALDHRPGQSARSCRNLGGVYLRP